MAGRRLGKDHIDAFGVRGIMKLEAFIVNAFSTELAEGNPAGVVLYNDDLSDDILQKIAIDIGKSDTGFIRKEQDAVYSIRWFSPKKEMPLCGHATLAAAKVLFEQGADNEIAFISKNNRLIVKEHSDETMAMEFPLDEYSYIEHEGMYRGFFGDIEIVDCIFGKITKKVILRIDDQSNIESIKPDYGLMLKSKGVFTNGIGITKKSLTYDFESRYFNPWAGVNEDPITGSVHTVLAGYWGNMLGKSILIARQSSYRPGILKLEIREETVVISGNAKIIFAGKLEL